MLSSLAIVALAVCIFYSYRMKRSIAPAALTCAFLIGGVFMQMSVKELIAFIPVQILFHITAISLFFGYAIDNGTLAALANRLLFRVGGNAKIAMPMFYLFCIIVSMAGPGIYASAFLAPIAFELSEKSNTHPLLAYSAVTLGTTSGSNFITSAGGVVIHGLLEQFFPWEQASQLIWQGFGWTFAITTVCFAVIYCICRGWRASPPILTAPPPLSGIQKKTLALLILVTGISILPNILHTVIQVDWILEVKNILDIGMVMFIGAFCASLLQLGDERHIIACHIPWNTILMLSSISVLLGVAQGGMTDHLLALVQEEASSVLLLPALGLSAGIMSMFSSAMSVVIPLLFTLVGPLIWQTHLPINLLFMIIFTGATLTGVSPLSTNGSMALSGCLNKNKQAQLLYQAFLLPVLNILLLLSTGLGLNFLKIV